MSQSPSKLSQLPESLGALYAPIQVELEQAEATLRETLSSEHAFVDELVQHGFQLGGKRLRPALTLLSGRACGSLVDSHPTLAAAMEVIHTATLVHDDVLDDATTRRHLATINAQWSTEASVLTGDYLLAQSLCMAADTNDPVVIREIAGTCRHMCEGELRQVAERGNLTLDEDEYFRIIDGKTASLLAACCRLGAHLAGASDATIAALGRYGTELGLAFQIVDDLLDLLGDEATVGKSLGSDLAKQKMTLPLIRLFETASPERRSELETLLTSPTSNAAETFRAILHESDAIEYARTAARSHVDAARQALEALPDSPARDSLEGIAEFVLQRKH